MSIGIDEIFEMLNCNNDMETQKKGIEEAQKIKNFSILVMPIDDKEIWENCAKIISQKTDEALTDGKELYLFEWLKDERWPGFNIIYNRIKSIPAKLIKTGYSIIVEEAVKLKDEKWLINLAKLAENKEMYESLKRKEKNMIKRYIKMLEKSR